MRRSSFTLLELLLAIAIITVIAGIVVLAINPQQQLSKAQNAKRVSEMNQLEKALVQFSIDKGALPDATKFSKDPGNPTSICSQNATDTAICIDATPLVAQYIAAIPKDPTELCSGVTGYGAYVDRMGPHIVQKHDVDLSTCPVSIFWSDSTHGIVRSGMATLTGSLLGKTITVSAGSSLNLNGYNVTGGSIANDGTMIALGTESVDAAGGAWRIVGTGSLDVLGNQGTLASLALAPTAAGTVFKPTTALTVSGQLTVGSTAILDTTAANSTFNGAVQNNGAIIIGDNAARFNGGYDNGNGQTIFTGTTLPVLSYHDLTIDSTTASLSGPTNVNGTLAVLAGKTLNLTAGNILNVGKSVNVSGTISGAGTLNIGNSGGTVTVSNTGTLSGIDATHQLLLTSLDAWYLQNSGSLSYLTVSNANTTGNTTCNGCTNGGGNSGITYTTCGNSIIDAGETCDDGNTTNGDGCSASCQIEAGWACNGSPSWCTTTVTVGASPDAIAVLGAKVYVANYGNGTVSIIDTANGNAVTTVTVGTNPWALAVLGTKVYVANYSSSNVSIIDTGNGNAVTNVTVGNFPRDIAVLGTKIYLPSYGYGSVSIIDTANGNTVTNVAVGSSTPWTLSALGTKVYAANNTSLGTVSIIDTGNGNAVTNVTVGSNPRVFAILGTKVYVANYNSASVSVIDTENGNAVTNVAVSSSPDALAVLGTKVYVANYGNGTVSIIDTANGNAVTNVTVGRTPKALAVLGTKVYVANGLDGSVSVIDTANGNAVTNVAVGSNPFPLAVLGTKVYVGNYNSNGTVSIIGGH